MVNKTRDSCNILFLQLLAQVNQEVREKEATIKEKKNFLDREVENNRELERKIAAAERLATKLRQELQEKESSRVRLQDEVSIIAITTVCSLAHMLYSK